MVSFYAAAPARCPAVGLAGCNEGRGAATFAVLYWRRRGGAGPHVIPAKRKKKQKKRTCGGAWKLAQLSPRRVSAPITNPCSRRKLSQKTRRGFILFLLIGSVGRWQTIQTILTSWQRLSKDWQIVCPFFYSGFYSVIH